MSTRTKDTATQNQIIGTVTRYHGSEHPYLLDTDVRIVAVLHRGNTEPNADGEIQGYEHLESDDEITRYGGLTADDRVEVVPWIAKEGRFSFVTSAPLAEDLASFEAITKDR